MNSQNLKARIQARRVDPGAPPPGTPPSGAPGAGIAPGEQGIYVEKIGQLLGAPPTGGAPVLRYLVVTVAGRRRAATAVLAMPLDERPAAPSGLSLTADERQLTLTWQPSAAGQSFRVYDVDQKGQVLDTPPPAGPPLTEARFTTTVEFGKPRCFTVRAVRVAGGAVAEGPPAPPECATPADRYPPAAPTGLFGAPSAGAVTLTWDPVEAADLAGYVVLRGEGANAKLQPLTPAPMTVTTYRDTTVKPNVLYVYAVVAVDRSGNVSGESKRELVTARD
jgi:hypothetical protein